VLKVSFSIFHRARPPPHELIPVALAHAYIGHPPEVLNLLLTDLPVLDAIDLHGRVGGIEGHLMEKAQAVDYLGGTIVPLIIRDASSLLGGLALLEHLAMLTLFHPQDRPEVVGMEGLERRSIGTEAVFRDDELERGMSLPQLGHKAFGGIAFAVIFGHAIAVRNRFRHERNGGPLVRLDERGA